MPSCSTGWPSGSEPIVYDYPGDQPRRRRQTGRDQPRSPGRRSFRPDRPPQDRPRVPDWPVVRLDDRAQSPAPRAAPVSQGGRCRERSPAATSTSAERLALRLGRLVPGNVARLPLRRPILTYNSKAEFPALLEDRWSFYLEENGLTPIKSLAHRVTLLTDLDLRPILGRDTDRGPLDPGQ